MNIYQDPLAQGAGRSYLEGSPSELAQGPPGWAASQTPPGASVPIEAPAKAGASSVSGPAQSPATLVPPPSENWDLFKTASGKLEAVPVSGSRPGPVSVYGQDWPNVVKPQGAD
jgi:hypothetical protein